MKVSPLPSSACRKARLRLRLGRLRPERFPYANAPLVPPAFVISQPRLRSDCNSNKPQASRSSSRSRREQSQGSQRERSRNKRRPHPSRLADSSPSPPRLPVSPSPRPPSPRPPVTASPVTASPVTASPVTASPCLPVPLSSPVAPSFFPRPRAA